MSEWISVDDEKPPPKRIVLAYKYHNDSISLRQRGEYDDDWFDERGNSTMNILGEFEDITHWMPLPEPPK